MTDTLEPSDAVQFARAFLEGDTGCYSNAAWRGCVERLIDAIDARPVVSEEKWSSEIVPNRRGWGWIARVFLNGELDHERAFESLDAATEHAEHFAALTPTEGGE